MSACSIVGTFLFPELHWNGSVSDYKKRLVQNECYKMGLCSIERPTLFETLFLENVGRYDLSYI